MSSNDTFHGSPWKNSGVDYNDHLYRAPEKVLPGNGSERAVVFAERGETFVLYARSVCSIVLKRIKCDKENQQDTHYEERSQSWDGETLSASDIDFHESFLPFFSQIKASESAVMYGESQPKD